MLHEIFVSFSAMNGHAGTFYVSQMRNDTAASAYDAEHLRWRSPALFLFVGIAGMLALIGLASMVLLCFWWKIGANSVEANDPERVSPGVTEGKEEIMACDIDKEEKVLVIMPGDEKPTFIAKELSSASATDSSQV